MSRKKQADAADAQVEDLVREDEPRDAAEEGVSQIDPGPPTILCIKAIKRVGSDIELVLHPFEGLPSSLLLPIGDRPALLEATEAQIADATVLATELRWPELGGERIELAPPNTLLEDARLLDEDGAEDDADAELTGDAANHVHDALSYLAIGIDPGRAEPPKNVMDINVLAAFAAASVAYGTTEEDGTTLPRFDRGWSVDTSGDGYGDHKAAAECAAALLRRPLAQLIEPETIVIHLRRNGYPDTPAPEGRIAMAWRVFAFTLAELDAFDRRRTEALAAAQAAENAARGPTAQPRDRLTFAPPDRNPLSELGRVAQQRLAK